MNEGLQVSKKKCPVCGKKFEILYCDMWVYKDQKYGSQGYRYYCSHKCKRAYEREHEQARVLTATSPDLLNKNKRRKPESSEELIYGALAEIEAGRDPVTWLEERGYDHWKKWYCLRDWAKKHKPELLERMPKTLARKKARTSA